MNRHTEDITTVSLPLELLVVVAEQGEWLHSGALARTCKAALRLFTHQDVLRPVVESCLARDCLLRWLLLALPSALLTKAPPIPWLKTLYVEVPRLPATVFVTGGEVAQRLYCRQWEGDVDVWVATDAQCRALRDENAGMDNLEVVVRGSADVERAIERFDMSVVQQGYLCDWDRTAYCTALSLYSYYNKVLVALPSRECVEYNVDTFHRRPLRDLRTFTATIWRYIRQHDSEDDGGADLMGRLHNGAYHECVRCGDANYVSSGHLPFQRWRQRMATYAERFPDFKVVYCHAPEDTTAIKQ